MSAPPVVVEVLDGHGRVRLRERVALADGQRSFTLGRALAADVLLDDPHVAPLHASIEVAADGTLRATDLGSVNGIVVDGRRHRDARDLALPASGAFQLGRTRLRVRTGLETLAPETPDHGITADLVRNLPGVAAATALVWAGLIVYSDWAEAPRDAPTVIATSLTYGFAIAAAWSAVWALLSRVILGEWRWATHAAILFGVSSAAFVLDTLVDVAWFSFALPPLAARHKVLWTLAAVVLLYGHLANVSPGRRRTLALFAAAIPVLFTGTAAWVQARNQARDVNFIAVEERLFPPALRLRSGDGIDEYFAEAQRLRERSDARRKALSTQDADTLDDGE